MAKGDIVLRLEGKVTGAIKGESACAAHPEAIDVHEFSWGMTGPASLSAAGASARTALSEIRITKSVDRATTALMSVMRTNEPIKKAILTVRKAGSAPAIDYLVITIERGRITSHNIATAGPDSPEVLEHLSMAFEKIEIAYAAQDAKGSKSAASTFTASIT